MRMLPVLTFGTLMLPLGAHAGDPHSYAQPDQVVITHLDLDLKINFAHKQLDGIATLKLDWKNPTAPALVLDTRDLKIASISALDASGKATALKYVLAPRDKELGSKLTIVTPKHPSQVRIVYTTSPEASGLQWLTPAQTADKKAPFMFSQSESIHARSWVPLQDSPAIRFTYDAHVSAPKNIRVAMSALNDAEHPLELDGVTDGLGGDWQQTSVDPGGRKLPVVGCEHLARARGVQRDPATRRGQERGPHADTCSDHDVGRRRQSLRVDHDALEADRRNHRPIRAHCSAARLHPARASYEYG